jgi:mannose-6-phosphate isomerase-like protein (cupin superfamily)
MVGAVAMKSNLVSYICRAKVHVDESRNASVIAGSPVTVYEGEWAYCPAGAPFEHEWQGIEPVTLANLKFIEIPRPHEAAAEDSRN